MGKQSSCGYVQKWDYARPSGRLTQLRVAARHDMPETLDLLLQGFHPLGPAQLYHDVARVRAWPVRGQNFTMVVLYPPLLK